LSDLVAGKVDPHFGALADRPMERVRKADITESYKLIGWQPSTSLQAGLACTVEWNKRQAKVLG
jgi:UDP-glucose 4-epimerase